MDSTSQRGSTRLGAAALAVGVALLAGGIASRAGATSPGPRVEARAAWSGLARPATWSELAVGVFVERGGDVTIEASGGGPRTVVSRTVEPGVPTLVRLPVDVGEADGVDVTVHAARGGTSTVRVALQRVADDERVIAAPRGFTDLEALRVAGARVLEIDPLDMPLTARAFELVDVLVVTPAMLAALDAPARDALERHLAACGRVVATSVADADADRLQEVAGCDGTLLRTLPADAPLASAVRELLGTTVPASPIAPSTDDGAPPTARAAVPLAVFFAAYGAVLVLGALTVRRAGTLLALPCVATLLLVVAFQLSPPDVSLVVWTRRESGAATARFVALLRVASLAPRRVRIDVPSQLGPPRAEHMHDLAFAIGAKGEPRNAIEVDTALLRDRALSFRGAVDNPADLLLDVDADGVRVTNGSGTRSGGGYLGLPDDVVSVPPLDPGAEWRPSTVAHREHSVPPSVAAVLADGAQLLVASGVPAALRPAGTRTTVSGWTVTAQRAVR